MSNFDPDSAEQTDQEQVKHTCKFCNKSFPCGRSLGGHMRSHVINSTDHHPSDNGGNSTNNNTTVINASSNSNDSIYELRKDPKKTPKAKDSSEIKIENSCLIVLDKLCKECGKGFQSWKALFGHMKCHSDKIPNKKTAVLNQDSWISQPGNDNSHAKHHQKKKSRSRNGTIKKGIVCSATTATVTTTTNTTITTASSSISMNANNASTSVVSEIDQEQEEEIAMCLMMLSRDVGKCGDEFESPSGFLNKKLIQNGCKIKKLAKTEGGFDFLGRSEVGFDRLGENVINRDEFVDQSELGFVKFEDSSSSKRKFECTTCNKSFDSYQALGGHRASHKILKGCFDSKNDNKNKNKNKSEPVLDHEQINNGCCAKTSNNHQKTSSFNLGGSLKNTRVVGSHECSICLRIFSSGQALGGHKRSHLIAEAKLNQQNMNVIDKFNGPVREIRGFLDLNMPPEEQEEQMMMNSWGYNHESTLLSAYRFQV